MEGGAVLAVPVLAPSSVAGPTQQYCGVENAGHEAQLEVQLALDTQQAVDAAQEVTVPKEELQE